MGNLMKAFQLALQVLAAVDLVKAGQPAVVGLEVKGVLYKVTLEQVKL